jgi:hypothetical protein
MFMSCHRIAGQNHGIHIDNTSFENVPKRVRVWTGLTWLRIGVGVWLFEHGNELSVSVQDGKFLTPEQLLASHVPPDSVVI